MSPDRATPERGAHPSRSILARQLFCRAQGCIRSGQRLYALSRICTHMGCLLNVDGVAQGFVCPCHGAEFDLRGRLRPKEYSQPLLPLPELSVRVDKESVEVWSI